MPVLTGIVDPDGPFVDILVGWGAKAARGLRAALKPVPPAVKVRALIDTGAEITCVDASVIQILGLPISGWTFANLPAHGGLTVSIEYDASLAILHPSGRQANNLVVPNLSIMEVPLATLGFQALVGRDVLSRCRLLYHGPKRKFRLSY